MKSQWMLIVGLLAAIIIAVFAVFNVGKVPVDYVFGEAHWPLVLVILGSALLGALVSGLFAVFRTVRTRRELKVLQRQITEKEGIIADQQNEIAMLQKSPELANEIMTDEYDAKQ
ncbi:MULTISPECIES: LapA family protein [Sporosarcina]|uniref:LapA family protein n=1 Tax=Sporosarcina TaxID=1569 RepID=UPI00058F49FD|nr:MULTISPECIES: lipopolysaccharide assembly protein LapA domain-containing protein [Sporosarcina]WJY28205.1 lipopolysaccharide assembly protein LapA domain-containing protein [Sporosarcina sp. 0.2-SM1T-5]